MSEINTITFDLEINATKADAELRRMQGVFQGYLGLLQQLDLPPASKQTIKQLQNLIRVFDSARKAALAFQAARLAAGDPLAWAQAGLMMGTLAMDIGNTVEIRRPQP